MRGFIAFLLIAVNSLFCTEVLLNDGYIVKGLNKGKSVVFHSIRYAAAPLGNLRWKAPHAYVHNSSEPYLAYDPRLVFISNFCKFYFM
jgi:hypothetical protein